VFVYLVRSGTISSKKLQVLVGSDVLHLNFSGASASLIHNGYVNSIALCHNLTKLNLSKTDIQGDAWGVLGEGFHRIEEIDVSNTSCNDLFCVKVAPTLKVTVVLFICS
jgi:hypothetical protein